MEGLAIYSFRLENATQTATTKMANYRQIHVSIWKDEWARNLLKIREWKASKIDEEAHKIEISKDPLIYSLQDDGNQ